MKFLYEYRTPDNAKHNGVICASDKEAAYSTLKKQGIKPSRFSEAPGFFNKLFGKGKRWMVIGVLGVGCLVLGGVALNALRTSRSALRTNEIFESIARRQIFGDAIVIEKGIRTGWRETFPNAGEQFLASFALPGQPPAVMCVREDELAAALARSMPPSREDALEVRQIKSIVEGLKAEAKSYLAEGGTLAKYANRLVRRQQEEIGYYQRAKTELEAAQKRGASEKELETLWESRNEKLSNMGIRPVALPE